MHRIASFGLAAMFLGGPPPREPPNRAAAVTISHERLSLRYQGATIVEASIATTRGVADLRQFTDTMGGKVTQVTKWTALEGGRITVSGTIRASAEAWPAEVEPREDGLPVVRHAVGRVENRLNRAVYDRRGDWVVSVDFPARVLITPVDSTTAGTSYRFTATGGEVAIRFRPRYYQHHRGLTEYRPWTYQPWRESVAGWTSWYAFFDRVTEGDIHRTADVQGDVLRPYGFRYLQIDDGYQQLPIGMPDHWLTTNQKFPSGLASLQRYLAGRGLEGGIWTNVSFQDSVAARAHPNWFVRHPDGTPAKGNWIGYVMDGSAPGTLANLVTPVYRGLKAMGWTYFKLDALRHLRYEGYNSFAGYFGAKRLDRTRVYRTFVESVRNAIGREVYLLACWGIRPELIGLVDGMRVGDDGFGYGSFAQYNSFNNVVWRNDPDHIELHQPDGFRAATLTSLTGSVLMLTDQPEVYRTDRAEAARRAAPVLFTRPGQLYDVDPSRSSLLSLAGEQTSGAGPRPFDADQRLVVPLYQLDVARPFEQWTVLARTGGDSQPIALHDLGLADSTDYLGFEFWSRQALGVVRDSLRPGPVDPRYQVQVFCLRRRLEHPQILATSRHVTCGGPDLQDIHWEAGVLSGTSDIVAGDRYALFVHEPAGYRFERAEADGAALATSSVEGDTRTIKIESERGGRVRWRIRYAAR